MSQPQKHIINDINFIIYLAKDFTQDLETTSTIIVPNDYYELALNIAKLCMAYDKKQIKDNNYRNMESE